MQLAIDDASFYLNYFCISDGIILIVLLLQYIYSDIYTHIIVICRQCNFCKEYSVFLAENGHRYQPWEHGR